jgi:hypothetical protein
MTDPFFEDIPVTIVDVVDGGEIVSLVGGATLEVNVVVCVPAGGRVLECIKWKCKGKYKCKCKRKCTL